MRDIGKEVAKAALDIGAIKLSPNDPFTWASGYRMPIYNDNRMFLTHPEHRDLIVKGLNEILTELPETTVIAGTATAGIPWGAMLSRMVPELPFTYIRDKPKGHGLKNQIEGIDAKSDYQGERVLVIEDLISTGGSSAKAVQAVRDANGVCSNCASIFSYGLDQAEEMFAGKRAYDKEGKKLSEPCMVKSLLNYKTLLEVAKDTCYLTQNQVEMLAEWRKAPFEWGERNGFPKVEK